MKNSLFSHYAIRCELTEKTRILRIKLAARITSEQAISEAREVTQRFSEETHHSPLPLDRPTFS